MQFPNPKYPEFTGNPHLVHCKHCKKVECVTAEFIANYLVTQRWAVYYQRHFLEKFGVKNCTNNEIRCFLYS